MKGERRTSNTPLLLVIFSHSFTGITQKLLVKDSFRMLVAGLHPIVQTTTHFRLRKLVEILMILPGYYFLHFKN